MSDQPSSSNERDMDAEFAALTGELNIPDELAQLDNAAPQAGSTGRTDDTAEFPPVPGPEEVNGSIHPEDVPRNTFGAPTQAGAADGAAASSAASDVPVPKAVKVAVVITPVASAEVLASLCAMRGLECTVVPATSGAVAVKQFVSAHSQWDVAELLGGADSEPAEAAELAANLSMLSRAGVILMTADLATDVGIETGLSGTITARRYVGGQAGEEASAGLVLGSLDQVVEDVLLGQVAAEAVPGALDTTQAKPSKIMRWFGRGFPGPRS